MGWRDYIPRIEFGPRRSMVQPATTADMADVLADQPLSLRREAVSVDVATRAVQAFEAVRKAEASMTLPYGMTIDPDDGVFRKLGSGSKMASRDLQPLHQDRMLEISWYLWEQNPLAKRLIVGLTDMILGEGITVTAEDERIKEQLDLTWSHPSNLLAERIRSFYNFLSLTGELILPTAVNPITGRPNLGFIDPMMVERVIPEQGNILVADFIQLKSDGGVGTGEKLKVIRVNPATGLLEGDVFYFRINSLPNSLRGRSDLLPLADWLDLFDQYLFAEVERLNLLSNFVWDYKIEGATPDVINQKLKAFPSPKPGTVFAHNEKETLEARTPDLKAQDRSEVAKMLRVHIAGGFGVPVSHLGDIDSNRATIEGQNDVMSKTPAARQKEFMSMLRQIVVFTIQSTTNKNRALYRDARTAFTISMPEIQAKDVTRVGQAVAGVATAMQTASDAGLVSKRVGTVTICAVLQHLGVNEDPKEVMAEAQREAEERQARADEMQANMAAAARAAGAADDDPEMIGARRANKPRPPQPRKADDAAA